MKKVVAMIIGVAAALAIITFPSKAQQAPSATYYGANRLTNGTAFIEPTLSSQLPAALVGGALSTTNATQLPAALVGGALSTTNTTQLPAALVNGAIAVFQAGIPITTLSSANASVTLTIPASGSGLFHYITSITATRTCTTAISGTAVLGYTSTNLPNSMAWSAGNACAVGSTTQDIWNDLSQPIKSSASNTNTTIVAPAAGATGVIRLSAVYFAAP
jgi:hypothetical protein